MLTYNLFTEVFNPRRGMVEVFLRTIHAHTYAEAKSDAKKELELGEKMILRKAK